MATDNGKQTGLSRRNFIKGAMAGAAAVAATGSVLPREAKAARAPTVTAPVCLDGTGDIALINGRILTLDSVNTVVGAVTIRGGRIAEVGTVGTLGPCSQTIDLGGRTVIPGLVECHTHYLRAGKNPGHEVRIIETATSILELQQMIFNRAQTVPAGDFITCIGGWNRTGFAENRLPTPSELNAAAPLNPVYLSETGGGSAAVTNSSGIAFFQSRGVTVNTTTGVLSAAQGLAALQAVQTEADKLRGTQEVLDFAASLGTTMIIDVGEGTFGLNAIESQYPYALSLWRQGKLSVRYRPRMTISRDPTTASLQDRIFNNVNRLGDDMFRWNGFGEQFGLPDEAGPTFFQSCQIIAAAGFSMTVHSTDGGSSDIAHVTAFQQANAVNPIRDLRWSLAHVNLITPNLIQALADMGAGVVAIGWRYTSAGTAPFGPPYRSLLQQPGLHIGCGTDSTNVAPFNPWLQIYYMTTGLNNAGNLVNPGQTISRLDALKICTSGGTWHSFDDDQLGTIETGKLADLVVLSDDPLTVSDDKLRKISSVLTLQAGKVVHQTS